MKKLFSTLFALAVVVSMTMLTSCSGGPSNESVGKIIEKYQNGDKLTEADYGTVIDYVDAAMDDVIPLYKEVQEAQENSDMDKLKSLQDKAMKLQEKYSKMDGAIAIMDSADDAELGEANVEKAKKLIEKMQNAGISMGDF